MLGPSMAGNLPSVFVISGMHSWTQGPSQPASQPALKRRPSREQPLLSAAPLCTPGWGLQGAGHSMCQRARRASDLAGTQQLARRMQGGGGKGGSPWRGLLAKGQQEGLVSKAKMTVVVLQLASSETGFPAHSPFSPHCHSRPADVSCPTWHASLAAALLTGHPNRACQRHLPLPARQLLSPPRSAAPPLLLLLSMLLLLPLPLPLVLLLRLLCRRPPGAAALPAW